MPYSNDDLYRFEAGVPLTSEGDASRVRVRLNGKTGRLGDILFPGNVRPGRVAVKRNVSQGFGGTNTVTSGGSYTIAENHTIEDDADLIRVVLFNDQTNPSSTAAGPIGYSPSASCSGGDPVDANGNILNLNLFTWNNAGANLSPDQQMAAAFTAARSNPTTFTLPAAPYAASGNQANDGVLFFSDWMPLKTIARGDGGPGRLLHIRSYLGSGAQLRGPYPTAGVIQSNPPYPAALLSDGAPHGNGKLLTNRDYQLYFTAGNFVSPQASMASWASTAPISAGRGAIYALEVVTRSRGIVVQAVGDSILQGWGTSTGYDGFVSRACAQVSQIGRPVHFLNSAIYGSPMANYLSQAARDLSAYPVHVCVIQTWSGNDVNAGMTAAQQQAAADQDFSMAMAFAEMAQGKGATPVFVTPVPQPLKCTTPAQDATRLSVVSRCLAMQAAGALVIDLNGLWGDGGSPVNYRAGLSPDQYHGNDIAQGMAQPLLGSVLQSILANVRA